VAVATALALTAFSAWAQDAEAPSAVDLHGNFRLWSGFGVDTNPQRNFVSPGVYVPSDVFGSLLAQLAGALDTERLHLGGSLDGGGRLFFVYTGESTEVQSANAAASYDLTRFLGLGVDGAARDRRGAERDYSDLLGHAFIDFFPDRKLDARLHVGAHRFIYWDHFDYSFHAPQFGGTVRYRFDRRHSIAVYGDFEPRIFNAQAIANPNDTDPPVLGIRKDGYIAVGLSYAYRGPWQVGFDYGYVDSSSNSFGQSYQRHRLALSGGVRLPLGFMAMGQAVLSISQYPDGVYLSSDLLVLEDDENSSSLSVKLLHPLGRWWDVEARYGLYYARLPNNDLSYLRQVFTLGFSVHH
jgi:hypothetical protein